MAPAVSTPVGPAPTTTKVIALRRRGSSSYFSACSNAVSTRRLTSSASLRLLIPGAKSSHSGLSKYEWRAPPATIR